MKTKTKRRLFRFRSSRPRRTGVTLTEALISMGVASVGMFGVFVLIPFCGRQAELGLDYDLSAATAKQAVERFEVFQMNSPDAWALPNGNRLNVAGQPWRGSAICIDPRMITRNGARTTFPTTSSDFDSTRGIYAPPVMPRITLFNRGGTAMIPPTPEMRALADHIFQSSDDLIFQEPVDKQSLPSQLYEDNAVRSTNGKMSWMAMVTPQPNSPGSDLYRLYIIVFKSRDLNPGVSGELVLNIQFTGIGSGGGDAVLADGTLPSGNPIYPGTRSDKQMPFMVYSEPVQEEFRIHRGSWLMICRNIEGGPQINTPVFGWYRVSKFDPLTGFITLEGSDWSPTTNPSATDYYRDYAVFLPQVTMVYEKTIRLETPSLWSPQ